MTWDKATNGHESLLCPQERAMTCSRGKRGYQSISHLLGFSTETCRSKMISVQRRKYNHLSNGVPSQCMLWINQYTPWDQQLAIRKHILRQHFGAKQTKNEHSLLVTSHVELISAWPVWQMVAHFLALKESQYHKRTFWNCIIKIKVDFQSYFAGKWH